MSFVAFQKLWRLAGIDHTHVNGLRNKFCESDESVIASARACLTPMFPAPYPGCEIMPVFSSGQSARQAPDTFRALGSTDLIYAAGGGIMGHPMGPAAGVRSLQQAWEAATLDIPLAHLRSDPSGARRRARSCSGPRRVPPCRLLYTFYGDDFTGSTDVLEQLAANGVPAVLFLAPPTPEQLGRFPDVQAFGIAGDSRSRSPEWMTEHLPPNLSHACRASARHHALQGLLHLRLLARRTAASAAPSRSAWSLRAAFVPIVVGAPHLRRFVAFKAISSPPRPTAISSASTATRWPPSGHADARSRPAAPSRCADSGPHRSRLAC